MAACPVKYVLRVMDSSMYNQWVQSPIQDAVPHELAAIINNSSSATTDINDFTTLTDLAGM